MVACFDIGCGSCYFCKQENYSCCKNTNPSVVIDAMWGQGTAGFYGYSHLTGGWQGGQAEYVRVPFGKSAPGTVFLLVYYEKVTMAFAAAELKIMSLWHSCWVNGV